MCQYRHGIDKETETVCVSTGTALIKRQRLFVSVQAPLRYGERDCLCQYRHDIDKETETVCVSTGTALIKRQRLFVSVQARH